VNVKRLYILLLLTVLPLTGAVNAPSSYLERLKFFEGESYWTLNCSAYIRIAKLHKSCGGAAGMFNGCYGDMTVIAEYKSFHQIPISVLKPGDVIAFNRTHVAAYLGQGQFLDSDPKHIGVGAMEYTPSDPWFAGPVRVVRWNK
jgi:hypothetical protein